MPDNQDLKNLEEYLASIQRIELSVGGENSPVDRITKKHSTKERLYTGSISPGETVELLALQKELTEWLDELTKQAGTKGRLMSQRAMTRFLEKSERREITQKQLNRINRINQKQVERRIDLYHKQLQKETTLLKEEVQEFFLNARASGRTRKETLAELIKSAQDDRGIVEGFKKRSRRISIDAARREAQEQATAEYRKIAKPGEQWQWIAISTVPCPDCVARAGKILPYDRWVQLGLPGTGRTICMQSCKCQLVPVSVSDELFPDSKSYVWSKEDLVLTTAAESRTFKSKAAQPKKKPVKVPKE